jgi:hypothetical protein
LRTLPSGGPLVAEVVNSVVVDVAVPPVPLNVTYGLAAPGADHQASAGLGLHAPAQEQGGLPGLKGVLRNFV